MDLIKDLWGFLKVRKKFWLLPIILTLLLWCPDRYDQRFSNCAVHLHLILGDDYV